MSAASLAYSVRKARADDRGRLEELLAAAGLSTADVLAAGSTYWIAESPAVMIGAIGAEWGVDAALLRSAVVRDSWRGRGCGRRLVDVVLDEARRRGCGAVYLFSTGATGFWSRLGFREVPVAAAVAAVSDTSQVAEYRRLGTLCCERAWVRTVT